MAKEEKKTEHPTLIDYYGDPDEQTDQWTSTNFQNYWAKRLAAVHRTSALPLTVKEKSLWNRLVATYQAEQLVMMIDKWLVTSNNPSDFVSFYMKRNDMFNLIKDYEWE